LPGAGFDVVPTDCLAVWLKKQLPDANTLEIAFVILGSALSRGTTINTIRKLGQPGAVRKNGVLEPEPVGKRSLWVQFPGQPQKLFTMSIPWGDLSTAYVSTGIPNIVTYTGISQTAWKAAQKQSLFNWLLRSSTVQRLLIAFTKWRITGPDDVTRDKAVSLIQGTVTNPAGKTVTGYLTCPEAYSLTALATLVIARKVLNGQYTVGYQTPASAYGEDLVLEIPGVSRLA